MIVDRGGLLLTVILCTGWIANRLPGRLHGQTLVSPAETGPADSGTDPGGRPVYLPCCAGCHGAAQAAVADQHHGFASGAALAVTNPAVTPSGRVIVAPPCPDLLIAVNAPNVPS